MAESLSAQQALELMARAVPDIARRSVAVPETRLGVVAATQSGVTVSVLVDGDGESREVLSGVPQLLTQGQRVVVQFYPPHGAVVIGVLAVPGDNGPVVGSTTTEQFWQIDNASVASTSSTPAGIQDVLDTWTQVDSAGTGWTVSGNDLTCAIAGLWYVALTANWETDGGGTHRGVAMVIDRATASSAGAASQVVSAASQFGAGGGGATAGFGLVLNGWVARSFDAGDVITPVARQNSGAALDVDLRLNLRLVEVAA